METLHYAIIALVLFVVLDSLLQENKKEDVKEDFTSLYPYYHHYWWPYRHRYYSWSGLTGNYGDYLYSGNYRYPYFYYRHFV